MPKPVERDVRKGVFSSFVMPAQDALEYCVGRGRVHLESVVLDEKVVTALPVRPDVHAVSVLLPLIILHQRYDRGRYGHRSDGRLILRGLGQWLPFYEGRAFGDAHGLPLEIEVRPFQGKELPAAHPAEQGQVEEHLVLQFDPAGSQEGAALFQGEELDVVHVPDLFRRADTLAWVVEDDVPLDGSAHDAADQGVHPLDRGRGIPARPSVPALFQHGVVQLVQVCRLDPRELQVPQRREHVLLQKLPPRDVPAVAHGDLVIVPSFPYACHCILSSHSLRGAGAALECPEGVHHLVEPVTPSVLKIEETGLPGAPDREGRRPHLCGGW